MDASQRARSDLPHVRPPEPGEGARRTPRTAPPGENASAFAKVTRPFGIGFSRAISSTASLMSQAVTRAALRAMNCVQ